MGGGMGQPGGALFEAVEGPDDVGNGRGLQRLVGAHLAEAARGIDPGKVAEAGGLHPREPLLPHPLRRRRPDADDAAIVVKYLGQGILLQVFEIALQKTFAVDDSQCLGVPVGPGFEARAEARGEDHALSRGCLHPNFFSRSIISCVTGFNLQNDVLRHLALVWVIGIEMQSAAFFPELGAFHDQVSHGSHIAQLAQLRRQSSGLVQCLGLFP